MGDAMSHAARWERECDVCCNTKMAGHSVCSIACGLKVLDKERRRLDMLRREVTGQENRVALLAHRYELKADDGGEG